ncbi:MAG: ROK family protein [Anaerolineae bacterium]|nr:ROK family protein [Anaerolineae bacterium]
MSTKNIHTPLFAGLDIGGTKIEALLVDAGMTVLAQARHATNVSHPDNLVASAVAAIDDVLQQAQANREQLAGIGIGIPGQVNPATGDVALAVNLNLTAYPLGEVMSTQLNTPIRLENDLNIAALGVYRWLNEQGPVDNIAYLSLGTGVAAGVVLNGRLYRGSNGMAGEIGHITVEPEGALCNCGARGCLETIISGTAIVKQALATVQLDMPAKQVHAGHVFAAAANGNAAAQTLVARIADYTSRAIQYLIMTYDVDKVVLGGGVSGAGDAFLTPVLQALATLRAQSDLFNTMLPASKITLLPKGYNAGVWGAVYLARNQK